MTKIEQNKWLKVNVRMTNPTQNNPNLDYKTKKDNSAQIWETWID